MPSTLFTLLASLFSYAALLYSRDKFVLDLLDKKFEIYAKALEFCSIVIEYGGLKHHSDANNENYVKALKAADLSFRSIGWHKTKALFDDDIHELFAKINKSYAYLISFDEAPHDEAERKEWDQRWCDENKFIWETVNKLPEAFKPYVYFGDYRR